LRGGHWIERLVSGIFLRALGHGQPLFNEAGPNS
jgi:hypothetical protein